MRKTLLILATVALLGILAAYVNPLGPEKQASLSLVAKPRPAASGAVASAGGAATGGAANAAAQPAQPATASGYKDGNFQGADYTSPYGDVQVSVTIAGGKITAVAFDQLTAADGESARIHSQAGPMLRQQTLAAQSANIDGVSGASYTTQSYEQSLQSALDKAKA